MLARSAAKLTLLVAVSLAPSVAHAAAAASLTDSFAGTTIDTTKWNTFQSGGTVSQGGGTLNLVPTPGAASSSVFVASNLTYSLTGSMAAIKAVTMPSGLGGVDAQFSLRIDGNNFVQWFWQENTLYAVYAVGGVRTTVATLTYSATNHAWWRIRESRGLVYWETSSDGATYTIRGTVATSSLFSISSLSYLIYAETWGSPASPGQASFANLNVAPAGVPLLSTLSDTFGGTSLGANWTIEVQQQGTITQSGGSLNLAPNANASAAGLGVSSARPYTLTGSAGLVQAKQVVSSGGGVENRFDLQIDGSNILEWIFELGSLSAVYSLNGTRTTLASVTYSATQHAWWRIRESGGTVYWDTSADSASWTNRASIASSALFDLSLLYVHFYAETWVALAAPGTAQYANFNNAPSYFLVSGVPATVTAGSAATVTVEVKDAFGNRATGYRGTVAFTSSDSQAALPANHAFTAADAGLYSASVTLKTAATQSITATDVAIPSLTGSQTGIQVQPAAASSLIVSGLASPREAGSSGSLTIDARDAFRNRATGYRGTVSFTSSDPRATLPASVTFAAADQGLRTVTGFILITPGSQSVTASDGTISGSQTGISIVDTTPPAWPANKTLTATARDLTSATLTWSAATDIVGVTSYRVYQNGVVAGTLGNVLTATITGLTTGNGYTFAVQAGDAAGNWSLDGPIASFVATPPDPAVVAPALDRTAATGFADSTSFLYSGSNPIQTGVAAGTIQSYRAAVLRGNVHTRVGDPLPGVRVTVFNHAEYGQTWTRSDGAFDMAVNGGSVLTLQLQRSGFLPVQRLFAADWQNYTLAADVVMISTDNLVSIIDLSNTSVAQAARGSISSDANEPRQATVIFPPSNVATMTLPNGSTQTLSSMRVRATEYTVGSQGPAAMPLDLPKTSAYTYAVAFTVDEADAAGATALRFSQTVYGYVENFMHFSVGTPVPSGYRDPTRAQWIPEDNGRVIKILSTSGGSATVDVDGSGTAATSARLTAMGFSTSELNKLATIYPAGQSLWRVPMQHFSDFDWNMPPGLPPNVQPIATPNPDAPKDVPGDISRCGSVIECLNQTLGEKIDIAGTPYSLNYRSSRTPGKRANRQLNIPIPGSFTVLGADTTCPSEPCAQNISYLITPTANVTIAGKTYLRVAVAGSIVWNFEWDGKDAYGRNVQGQQPVTVQICEALPEFWYWTPADLNRSFAVPTSNGSTLTRITRDGFRFQLCSPVWRGTLGGWDAKPQGLGGWNISAQHGYDFNYATLYRGDGEVEKADELNRAIIRLFGGNLRDGVAIDPNATSSAAGQMAVGPDGSLYTADGSLVWRITPDKIAHRFAGGGPCSFASCPLGDGGPATSANMNPSAVALGPDGNVYVADSANLRIRRIDTSGIITTIAGTGTSGFSPDGTPAAQAMLSVSSPSLVTGLIVASDGRIIFSDVGNNRIRVIGADGTLRTIAGAGPVGSPANCTWDQFGGCVATPNGDGGLASQAILGRPRGIALGKDGAIYFIDSCGAYVRKITIDQKISTLFRSDYLAENSGGCSIAGNFTSVVVADDGTLFVDDRYVIRRRRPDGSIVDIAGKRLPITSSCMGDWCPGTQTGLVFPTGLASGPDRSLFVTPQQGNGPTVTGSPILQITAGVGTTTVAQTVVASSDGSEVYVLDGRNRHIRTVDAVTGVNLAQLGYDAAGLLTSIQDRSGNITTIQRDGQENPIAIVSPYGQRTTITVDNSGYLSSVVDPANQTIAPTHLATGLLTQLIDGRSNVHSFSYDAATGFLTQDTEPGGPYQTLNRNGNLNSSSVTHKTALGRTTTYSATYSAAGDAQTRTVTDPVGLQTTTKTNADHTWSRQTPDAMLVSGVEQADPRFGINVPIQKSITTTTPSGLATTVTRDRTVSLSSPTDPLSLTSLVESVTINGRTSSSSYNRAAQQTTVTSAVGRVTTTTFDARGRVMQISPPGVTAVQLHYNALGQNDTITQGTRVTTLGYDANGFLRSILDPLSRSTIFGNDPVGRVTSETLPGAQVIGRSYDGDANVTSVTPPGRPAHTFSYWPYDLESDYTPPDVGQPRTTHTDYNLDKQTSNVSRPDGDRITPTYDPVNGRLTGLGTNRGTNSYGYNSTTGQLSSITTFDGVGLAYGYDGSLLKDITWSGPVSGNVHKTYDSSFRLSSESVTGGQAISFGYDNDDLLTSAGAMTITRDPATGFVTGTTLGAISESRTYDPFGAEQTYTVTANSTTLYSVNYGTRDGLGRIVNKTETVQGVTHTYGYTYDANGRLTDVTKDSVATSHYAYDANGNRIVGPGLVASPVYDNQDRLQSYANCTYTYKADGALQTKTCAGATTSYDYDAFGNLRGVTLPTGTAITYIIDGQNRRVGKKVNGAVVEEWLYQPARQAVAWLNADGSLRAQFVYGSHHQPEFMIKAGTIYRLVADQTGSIRLVVDSSGNVVERMDFDEFGNVLQDTAPGTQRFGFAGGLLDPDTGLTRFGWRDYAPDVGRWTAKDPLLFESGDENLFAYVHSDPINFIDPSGRQGDDGFTGGGGGDSGGGGASRTDGDGPFNGGGGGRTGGAGAGGQCCPSSPGTIRNPGVPLPSCNQEPIPTPDRMKLCAAYAAGRFLVCIGSRPWAACAARLAQDYLLCISFRRPPRPN
jgi:RHS repeat-associated protein